jgi:hypothetical protein
MHDQEKREGEMIQEVAALQQKLSVMQAAEESQRETEAALLESERRFRKIFSTQTTPFTSSIQRATPFWTSIL